MSTRRHPNVVGLSEIEPRSRTTGSRFGGVMKQLGLPTGAQGIGCTWYEVPPGRAVFPRHFHCANEESAFILEGEGTLRIGDETVPIRAGDYMTYPVGPKHAHQIVNTSQAPLRYLCFSTMGRAEVVGYPDSKKLGAMAAPSQEAAMKGEGWVRIIVKEDAGVDYYEGEDVG